MPREPKFIFLDNIVRCELEDPDTHEIVVGEAKCMPQDMDMMSEKTGGDIALYKATIKILRNKRKRTRQEYRVLKNLLKTYKNRPNFDTNDPYVRIYSYGQDIEYLNNCENNCREELRKYIDEKDNFYQKIRAMRKRDSNTDLK